MGTHVLLCAPVIPEFDRESGSKRIFNLLEYLRDAGFTVSFVAENPHGDERYARALRERGIAFPTIETGCRRSRAGSISGTRSRHRCSAACTFGG